MMYFLNLIRFKNLLLIAFMQILVKYVLFDALIGYVSIEAINEFTALNTIQFTALVLATLFITAAGYIINDIQDIETDLINKPNKVIINKHIKEDTAFNIYFGLTITGVALGMYVANSVGKNAFLALFVIVAGLLYLYATSLKAKPLVGNIAVSFLVALSIFIIGIFDLIPALTEQNKSLHQSIFSILIDYSLFAFFINLTREIVKDIEDINGDYKLEMKTLPIILGQNRTSKIAFGLCVFVIMMVMYWVSTYFYKHQIMIIYMLALVVAPLILCAIKLFSAKQKKEFLQISTILKVVMFTGICSMFLFQFIIK